MQIYQFWSHKMYPKGYFSANVQRVEKLCHSKRMIVRCTFTFETRYLTYLYAECPGCMER